MAAKVLSGAFIIAGISFSRDLVQAGMVDEHATDDNEPLLGRGALAACIVFAAVVMAAGLVVLPPIPAVATGVLALLMSLITLIDLKHFIIPNALSFPAVPLGMLANILVFHAQDWSAGLTESVIGAVLAAGSFYLLRAAWLRLRGIDGLGMGDVKLAAVAGAWLGPSLLAPACLASALAGLCAVAIMALRPGRKIAMNDEIPFGSFIAPVILGFWVWRVFDLVPIWLSAQP
jgi:leader peptidase (prepilin peptidase)/N-methyltransferase